jgi:hypothetical protein
MVDPNRMALCEALAGVADRFDALREAAAMRTAAVPRELHRELAAALDRLAPWASGGRYAGVL